MKKKILSLEKLIEIAQIKKKQGKKVVTYNGSFDLIHAGHIRSVQEAKQQGDVLFMLLNSDTSIRNYKGPFRPIIGEKERAMVVAGIEGVDYVGIFDDLTPVAILEKIQPDVHCTGSDWGANCVERETVERNGGKIHVMERMFSTTSIVKKILDVYSRPVMKAIFLDFEPVPPAIKALQEDYKFIKVKPEVDQLLRTVHSFGISLNDSWIISSKVSDIVTGRRANIKTIKLGRRMPAELKLEPSYYAASFTVAVKIILNKSR